MSDEGVSLTQLRAVLDESTSATIHGDDVFVTDLHHDSRTVTPGSAFIATRGAQVDGHEHVAAAVANGATAVVVDHRVDHAVSQLIVEDTRRWMGALAAAVHRYPAEGMTIVGITGTNGKTTVTHMLEAMARRAGLQTGLVGTIGAHIGEAVVELAHTTPEATDLHRLFGRMRDAQVEVAFIEVSSHALRLGRVDGLVFDVAAFTNLSQDHLDFHGTMDEYFAAKLDLFTPQRSRLGFVVTDTPWGTMLASRSEVPVSTVGFDGKPDTAGRDLDLRSDSSNFAVHLDGAPIRITVPLAGDFNAANALLAIAIGHHLQWPEEALVAGMAELPVVPGRLEQISAGQPFSVVVDYAHTPSAIETVIASLRPLATGRVIAVAGAGGDRDQQKRPMMGRALLTADVAIVTSDNPRSEDPDEIIESVLSATADRGNVIVLTDRRDAIHHAVSIARPGDIVAVLGRGHESLQDLGATKIPFDDRQVVREALEATWGADR